MPHIPGHQGDPPGVYKPRMQITDKGSTALEQEPYVPIDTDVTVPAEDTIAVPPAATSG